jgi:peptide/nickel transport system permease protein
VAAVKAYSTWDYVLGAVSLLASRCPVFLALIARLSIRRAVADPARVRHVDQRQRELAHRQPVPPDPAAAVLSVELMATLTRYTRSAMLEVLHADYVTTARSKGLSNATVIGDTPFAAPCYR